MAGIFDPNKDKDQEQKAAQQTPTSPPGAVPLQPVGSNSSIDANSGSPTTKGPTSSGRFTNIQSYLKANNGQSEALSNKLSNLGTQTQQKFDTAKTDFNKEAATAQVPLNQGIIDTAASNPSNFSQIANTADKQAFNRMLAGNYTGPVSLGNQEQLNLNAQNYKTLANQGGTESGRFNLLKTFFNRPNYTRGQQTLDNLMVQADKNQLKQLQANRTQAAQLTNNINTATNQAQATAKQYADEAAKAKTNILDKFTTNVNDWNNQLKQKAESAQQVRNNYYEQLQRELQNNQLSNDTLNSLGLTPGQKLYNTDLSQYITTNPNLRASAQNVALTSDYDKFAAVRNLLGDSTPQDVDKILNRYQNTSDANSFNAADNIATYYKNNLANDLSDLQSRVEPQLRAAEADYMNNLVAAQSAFPMYAQDNWARADWLAGLLNSGQQVSADDARLALKYLGMRAAERRLNDLRNQYKVGRVVNGIDQPISAGKVINENPPLSSNGTSYPNDNGESVVF